MPAFEDVVVRNEALIRKALQGGVWLGKYPAAAELDTLVADDGMITLPADYESVGWTSEDGTSFTVDEDVSEVRGWGSGTFLRRDIRSRDKSLSFAALETKRLTWELATAMDLSNTTMSASGEVTFATPTRPPTRYWRVLVVGVDGDGDQRYHFARFFPKASVTEMDDEAWSDGDDPLQYSVTMGAVIDNAVGYAERQFLWGPGALAARDAMGWTAAV